MRALWIGTVLAMSPMVAAEPAKAPPAKVMPKPPAKDEPDTSRKTPDPATRAPAMGGGNAIGQVITPAPHPDARPYPEGMVIKPPDVRDPIAIAPGGMALVPVPEGPWTVRLSHGLGNAFGTLLDLVIPKPL